jgi:hypothetical protein
MTARRSILAGFALVAAVALAGPVLAGANGNAVGKTYPTSQNTVHDCGNNRSITFAGPATPWPPNHKYFAAVITARGDGDDQVSIDSAGTHDEYTSADEEMNGSGNTVDDVSPVNAQDGPHNNVASVTQSIRSERSGQGDGRVYTFTVTGTFDGNECSATFTSNVPHDMRPSNR